MTPPAAAHTEFNAWYDTEHVLALARVPGVLCARRFKGTGSGPKYVALYHLTTPEVIESAEGKGKSESTPMPSHIRPHPLRLPSLRAQSLIIGKEPGWGERSEISPSAW